VSTTHLVIPHPFPSPHFPFLSQLRLCVCGVVLEFLCKCPCHIWGIYLKIHDGVLKCGVYGSGSYNITHNKQPEMELWCVTKNGFSFTCIQYSTIFMTAFCSTEIFLTLAYQFFISVSCLLNGFSLFSLGIKVFYLTFVMYLAKESFCTILLRDILMLNIISYLTK